MRTNSIIAALILATASLAVGCATTDSSDDIDNDDSNATSPGKFDLWQSADGWHFHLKSGNGSILLTSEAYTSRTAALNGVLSVETNGIDNAQFQVVPAKTGYLLHLVAGNNEIISFSQTYSTKSNATRAITSCVKAVETYLDKKMATVSGARADIEAGATNAYHFNIIAANGETVLSSESYTTEAAAWNGAFAVQDAAKTGVGFAIKTSQDGRFYFTLSADNGQTVGVSQMYSTQEAADAGEKSVSTTLNKLPLI
ncbi:MAG: DUF1508 domain-containing protein [Kofleriaceae bacterium]